jgi:hypothetical protein
VKRNPSFTSEDIPVKSVTRAAEKHCENVLLLGTRNDGSLYAAASTGDMHLILWWLESFKHKMMNGDYWIKEEDEPDALNPL